MPFPNFHSARVRQPGGFSNIKQLKELPNGIRLIGGRLKGETTTTVQAYRFPKSKFTPAQAKAWLKEHKIKPLSFEAAKKGDEADDLETKGVSWDTIGIIEEMIRSSNVNVDDSWSFSTEDQNKVLGENGDEWGAYASVHIGRDLTFERDNKSRYIYPVIKDGIVYKSALVEAKKKAEKDENWAFRMIDSLLGKVAEFEGMSHTDSSQTRADFFNLFEDPDESDDGMQEKFRKTDEGFLKGRAIVTNVGVFTYLRPDGNIVRELRPPEEVFSSESMRSLSMAPVTDGHPSVAVDSENIKKLQVGHAGDDVRQDTFHLSIPLSITNPDTVNGIENDGHRAISCGYRVDLEDKSGNWMGVPYDAIQRNIRYNHIAVNIDRARAGDDVHIKMDEGDHFDAICVDEDKKFKEEVNIMKKIKIDDVEYEAEETVVKAYLDATKKVDELGKEKEKRDKDFQELQAKHDSLKDENDQLKKDKEELDKKNPDEIKKAVDARITLLDTAKRAGIEVKDEDKDIDIKKAVIMKAFPKTDEEAQKEFKEKLDKAEVTYIDARFEAAVEYLEDRGEIEDKNKEDLSNADGSGSETVNSEQSRLNMIKRNEDAYKDKEDK